MTFETGERFMAEPHRNLGAGAAATGPSAAMVRLQDFRAIPLAGKI